jgi:hypothetical protein
MALPSGHLSLLRAAVEQHDEQLVFLRRESRRVAAEITLHRALIALVTDNRVLAALAELHESWDVAAELAQDPYAFCTSRDIQVPDDLRIGAVELDNDGHILRLDLLVDEGLVEVSWDARSGEATARPRGDLFDTRPRPLRILPRPAEEA